MVKEVVAKSAIYPLSRKDLPYKYDVNIYKGCSHGCKYCYARCSYKKYIGNNFQEDIQVKRNIAEVLDVELSKKDYSKEYINFGGVCDSYQPIEQRYELMRDVLKVLIKYKQPIILSTKSSLIKRDADLISQLSNVTKVITAFCITNIDQNISRCVESGASIPLERFEAMKYIKENTNAIVGMHIFPILPYLSDIEESLEKLFSWAKEADVDYVMTAFLYMYGDIKKNYLQFIQESYPTLYDKYLDLYKGGKIEEGYRRNIYSIITKLRKKYSVNGFYKDFV